MVGLEPDLRYRRICVDSWFLLKMIKMNVARESAGDFLSPAWPPQLQVKFMPFFNI